MRRSAAGIALGLAAAQAAATPSPCSLSLLRELGWRIDYTAIATPRIQGGAPCTRGSLAQAQAAGDLRAELPAADPVRAGQALQALLDDPATVCAYAFRIGDAARRAGERLAANPGFRFTGLQAGWIAFAGGAQAQGWQATRGFGRGYQPAASNSAALEAFYGGEVRGECGLGRQVAQLATQRELFGDDGFNTAFSAGELSIGTFRVLHDTDSILLGRHAGEFFADGKAVRTSALGRQAFMGAPGYIVHAFSRRFLDDPSNQAENFIVVDVSAEAAQALAVHGGLAYYDALNRRLWQLAQQLEGPGRRRFERLLYERDPKLRASLDGYQRQVLAQMDTLMDDPFYRGFVVYVHPRGVRPIGYHLARLLDRNPRTPYTVELTLHNLHTTLYRRWIGYRLQACANATYR